MINEKQNFLTLKKEVMMTTAAKLLSKGGKSKKAKKTAGEEKSETKVTATKAGTGTAKTKKKKTEVDLIIATSQQMELLTKAKALTLAKNLVEEVDFNYFKLGGVLSSIQANDFWKGVKNIDGEVYESFKDFMAGEYGMNYRKGMYLVGIYNSLVESEVSWDKVKDVGWTKLKELSSVLTKDNADEWIEKALTLTTIQLIDYIKNLDVDGGEDTGKTTDDSAKLTTMTFKLHEDQKETVQAALDKAMKDSNTDVASVALDYICMAFLETKTGKKKAVKQKTFAQLAKEMGDEKAFNAMGDIFPQYDIQVTPVEDQDGIED